MTPRARYVELQALHASAHEAARARSLWLGTVRAATFIGSAAALILWDILDGAPASVALAVGVLLFATFVVMAWMLGPARITADGESGQTDAIER